MAKSQLDGCGVFIKYILFFFNFVVFILGLSICGLGIWTLVDNAQVQRIIADDLYIPAAGILVAFGGIVAFVSFLGCCGAIKEVKCLLGLFFVIMLLLTIVIALGAIFAFVVKGKLGGELVSAMEATMDEYGTDSEEKKAMKQSWDQIQRELTCCGAESYRSWDNRAGFGGDTPFPESCCKPTAPNCNKGTNPDPNTFYDQGCVDKVKELVEKHAKPLAAVGISIAIIIVLSMIFSCALCLML